MSTKSAMRGSLTSLSTEHSTPSAGDVLTSSSLRAAVKEGVTKSGSPTAAQQGAGEGCAVGRLWGRDVRSAGCGGGMCGRRAVGEGCAVSKRGLRARVRAAGPAPRPQGFVDDDIISEQLEAAAVIWDLRGDGEEGEVDDGADANPK